jgi:glucose-1-phosphate adenylyltransferase
MPGDKTKSLASMGIYVFDAEYLYQLLDEDGRDEQSSHDFGKDIIPAITASGEAGAHPFPRSCVQSDNHAEPYWRDHPHAIDYWKANLDLASVVLNWMFMIATGRSILMWSLYRAQNLFRTAQAVME